MAKEVKSSLEVVAYSFSEYLAEVTQNGSRLDIFPGKQRPMPKYSYIVINRGNKFQVYYMGREGTKLGKEMNMDQLTKKWVITDATRFFEDVLRGLGVAD